ncbi:MAG TPA: TlpA disulfide reductase family protein [Polyangia bacterium]|jgi:thiol-disulfide isomerase/thioredoxin
MTNWTVRAGFLAGGAVALFGLAAHASTNGKPASKLAAKPEKPSANEATPVDIARLGEEMRKAKGRDLFVHLWASWCGPCLEELPVVDRFAREARARGATFISVSLDDIKRGAHVMDVLRQRAPSLTTFVARFDDPERFVAMFTTEWQGAIPALFAYDPQGHLRASVIGEIEPADIRKMLADIALAPASDEQAGTHHPSP